MEKQAALTRGGVITSDVNYQVEVAREEDVEPAIAAQANGEAIADGLIARVVEIGDIRLVAVARIKRNIARAIVLPGAREVDDRGRANDGGCRRRDCLPLKADTGQLSARSTAADLADEFGAGRVEGSAWPFIGRTRIKQAQRSGQKDKTASRLKWLPD